MKEILSNNFIHLSIFVGIVVATFLLAFLVNRFFTRLIRKSTEELKNDPTNYQFLKHTLVAIIYLFGFGVAIYSVPGLRALASTLLAGAGVLAVAVGFASQHALSNIISGMFIVVFKPFRVHDRLKIRELTGVVEDITIIFQQIDFLKPVGLLLSDEVAEKEEVFERKYDKEKFRIFTFFKKRKIS